MKTVFDFLDQEEDTSGPFEPETSEVIETPKVKSRVFEEAENQRNFLSKEKMI
jgi:hypothetical protein